MLMESSLKHAKHCLSPSATSLRGLHDGGILVCGSKGVGKTSFARVLCERLTRPPTYAFTTHVDCKQFKGLIFSEIRL